MNTQQQKQQSGTFIKHDEFNLFALIINKRTPCAFGKLKKEKNITKRTAQKMFNTSIYIHIFSSSEE
jgi:hypothetical protein